MAILDRQLRDDEILDVSIQNLKLEALGRGKQGLSTQVAQAIKDGKVERGMGGAPKVELDVLDKDLHLLQSGIFDQRIGLTYSGVPFWIAEVNLEEDDWLKLIFEHRIAARARLHNQPIKASRDTMTRAEFLRMMFMELREPRLRFICPQLHRRQAIAAGQPIAGGETGRSAGLSSYMTLPKGGYWGLPVTPSRHQLDVAEEMLEEAVAVGARGKAVTALMMAGIVENKMENSGTDGILQVTPRTAAAKKVDPKNIRQATNAFLMRGFATDHGAIWYAQNHPDWSAGKIAAEVEKPASEYRGRYDTVKAQADALIKAYGADHPTAGQKLGFTAGFATYEYARGQADQQEDSWTCGLRLAEEVKWNLFIAGAHDVYYVTDADLLRTKPKYTIEPSTVGAKVTFGVEVGKRTVIVRGRRVPKPSEAVIRARVDRWQAPPGTIVRLANYGVANDLWIVDNIVRGPFDSEGEIHVRCEQRTVMEPAAEEANSTEAVVREGEVSGLKVSFSGLADPISRAYTACIAIDQRNFAYTYGAGHGSWAEAVSSRGLDCSSSVSLALWAAGLLTTAGPLSSGQFSSWGDPGPGRRMTVWYNGGHVFIEFRGFAAQRFDTVSAGSGGSGPHLRYTFGEGRGGYNARHWPGG